jgi:hypothetical protein
MERRKSRHAREELQACTEYSSEVAGEAYKDVSRGLSGRDSRM